MIKELGKMKLTEEKRGGLVEVEDNDIDNTEKDIEHVAVCKILSNKSIIAEHFLRSIPKIWGVEGKVQMKKSAKNTYICKFKNKKTRKRVIEGRPWIYDKAIILFDKPKGDRGIHELEFRYVEFWVHFHNLPVVCLNRKYAKALTKSIGTFVKMVEDGEEDRVWGETLRVKVRMEVNKPLRRGTKVKVGSMAEERWTPITIEKLPDFYYQCGRLGHMNECEEDDSEGEDEEE